MSNWLLEPVGYQNWAFESLLADMIADSPAKNLTKFLPIAFYIV